MPQDNSVLPPIDVKPPVSKEIPLKSNTTELSKPKVKPIFIILGIVLFLLVVLIAVLLYLSTRPTKVTSSNGLSSSSSSVLSSDESALSESSVSDGTLSNSSSQNINSLGRSSSRNSSGSLGNSNSSVTSNTSTTAVVNSSASPVFNVTAANISVDLVDSPVKTCGQTHTYHFSGTITANTAGTASFYWYRNDLPDLEGRYPVQNIVFTGAGSKSISKDVIVTSTGQADPFTIQVQVFMTVPNDLYSNVVLVRFHNICI